MHEVSKETWGKTRAALGSQPGFPEQDARISCEGRAFTDHRNVLTYHSTFLVILTLLSLDTAATDSNE